IAARARTVGAREGGPGLPVVGWSTVGGDLRVARFLALHAMQALPLAGWAVDRWLRARSAAGRVALLTTAAAAYAGLTLLGGCQAVRDQPLLAPDATKPSPGAGYVRAPPESRPRSSSAASQPHQSASSRS